MDEKVEVIRVTTRISTGQQIRYERKIFDDFLSAHMHFVHQRNLDRDLHNIAVRWKKTRPRLSTLLETNEFDESFPCTYYGKVGDIEIRGTIKCIKDYAIAEYQMNSDNDN